MTPIAEILLVLGVLLAATILAGAGWLTVETWGVWKCERRKRKRFTRKGGTKMRWVPSYWSYSLTITYASRLWRKIYMLLWRRFAPTISALRLVPLAARALRVFTDSIEEGQINEDFGAENLLNQLVCENCGNQGLGVWLQRLPDKETGEVLSNRPTKCLCLNCLKKMSRKKTRQWTVVWVEAPSPPYEDGRAMHCPDPDLDDEIDIMPQPRFRPQFEVRVEPGPPMPGPIGIAGGIAGPQGPVGNPVPIPIEELEWYVMEQLPFEEEQAT